MNISLKDNRQTILKVLVGSHAHGLATQESDKDFRSVFVIPTEEIFRLILNIQQPAERRKGVMRLPGELVKSFHSRSRVTPYGQKIHAASR